MGRAVDVQQDVPVRRLRLPVLYVEPVLLEAAVAALLHGVGPEPGLPGLLHHHEVRVQVHLGRPQVLQEGVYGREGGHLQPDPRRDELDAGPPPPGCTGRWRS